MAREQRKLAAIIAADVVGYSRLMGRDESGTLARLREHRKQQFEPVLARHGGRLVKLTGDGALTEFGSAVDALAAAIEFQQAMEEANRGQPEETRIVFRVGLHLGDLIVDGDDLYGDGVNVAARLEAAASPGEVVKQNAIEYFESALRLSPLDPRLFSAHSGIANAYFIAGRYDEAIAWAAKALRQYQHLPAHWVLIASYALKGRAAQARAAYEEYKKLHPTARVSNMREWPRTTDKVYDKYAAGFRLAGMPD